MTINVSPVTVTTAGFEQELSYYLHSGKLRREQFVGFSREHLGKIIAERLAELKTSSTNGGEKNEQPRSH